MKYTLILYYNNALDYTKIFVNALSKNPTTKILAKLPNSFQIHLLVIAFNNINDINEIIENQIKRSPDEITPYIDLCKIIEDCMDYKEQSAYDNIQNQLIVYIRDEKIKCLFNL